MGQRVRLLYRPWLELSGELRNAPMVGTDRVISARNVSRRRQAHKGKEVGELGNTLYGRRRWGELRSTARSAGQRILTESAAAQRGSVMSSSPHPMAARRDSTSSSTSPQRGPTDAPQRHPPPPRGAGWWRHQSVLPDARPVATSIPLRRLHLNTTRAADVGEVDYTDSLCFYIGSVASRSRSGTSPRILTLVMSFCDNPPRKIPYYRLRPSHFGH
jgi:hypothetical protein